MEIEVSLGFLWRFLQIEHVDSLQYALFKSYGDICLSSRSSSLLDELSMYERDSNGLSLTSVQIELYFS